MELSKKFEARASDAEKAALGKAPYVDFARELAGRMGNVGLHGLAILDVLVALEVALASTPERDAFCAKHPELGKLVNFIVDYIG